MIPYPYLNLADSLRGDYERRAATHRLVGLVTRAGLSKTK